MKKKEEEKKVNTEPKPEMTCDDLYQALVIMDKKLNIVTNVMLEIQKFLDKKNKGELSI